MTVKTSARMEAKKKPSSSGPVRYGQASPRLATAAPHPRFRFDAIPIRTKPAVGPTGSALEAEADEKAARAMAQRTSEAREGQIEDEDEKELHREKWAMLHPEAAGAVAFEEDIDEAPEKEAEGEGHPRRGG